MDRLAEDRRYEGTKAKRSRREVIVGAALVPPGFHLSGVDAGMGEYIGRLGLDARVDQGRCLIMGVTPSRLEHGVDPGETKRLYLQTLPIQSLTVLAPRKSQDRGVTTSQRSVTDSE